VAEETMAEARAVMLANLPEKKASMHKNRVAEAAVLGSVFFAATGHLLIKSGLNALTIANAQGGLGSRLLGYLLHPAVIIGLAIYAMGTAMWVFAVSKREISYLFPLSALNYVVVALGGVWLFGEKIPSSRWTGILVVFAGVWLMQRWGAEESR
jgi:drug/metabolite transporter (DMT)-like permease